ncbi:MAG: tryptophan synthase subunit alpha [Spirochaetes bacterium]|jgi:tryptophan synthase alpha chain|nr:tryptophan synthase subunit alpha [Spirochaetota bacterium]
MSSYNGIYLVGNYPDSRRFIDAALKGLEFFDFLEVGIPFSDPVADGPVIVEAAFQALTNGETIDSILQSVDEIRKKMDPGKKIYFMNYANTAHAPGYEKFCKKCTDHSIAGMIVPDIPFSESGDLKRVAQGAGLEYIDFITPESTTEQIEEVVTFATGFVYAVSMRGITGQDLSFDDATIQKIKHARSKSRVPVVIGFGIRDASGAKSACAIADGFIMGTEPVLRLGKSFNEFSSFIDTLSSELKDL